MELASVLASEESTDQPVSVCPAIAAFLREHDDSIDDERRQDLYADAAKLVGNRSPARVQDERVTRLSEWHSEVRRRQSTYLSWSRRKLNRMLNAMVEEIPSYAFYGLNVHNDGTHSELLAIFDELLAIKPGRGAQPAASAGQIPVASPSRHPPPGSARTQAVGCM